MITKDKYSRVTETLRKNKPVLSSKEELVNRVMRNLTSPGKNPSLIEVTGNYLFGWASIDWMRKLMASAAILFFGFFIYQQVTLMGRVNRLEMKIVHSSSPQSGLKSPPDLKQKLFFEMVNRQEEKHDSITISSGDLDDLLQSYSDLQESYDKIKHQIKENSYINRILKKNRIISGAKIREL